MSSPTYPEIRVSTRSENPLTLVAMVRQALRQAHVDPREIRRFSDQALTSSDPQDLRNVCRSWVRVS